MSLLVGIIFAVLAFSATFRGVTPQPPLTSEDGTLCTKNGMNPVEGSPSAFVVCAKAEGEFKGSVSECPDGEVFERYTSSCVKDILTHNRKKRGDPPSKPEDDKVCTSTFSCKDCQTLRVCASLGNGKYLYLSDVNCTDGTGYCNSDKKTCSDIPSAGCGSKYECTGEGYFPDATDCTKYHMCYKSADSLMSETLNCESNQVYSTAKKMCVNKVRPADCHVASCPVNKTLVAAFAGEPSFFVICMTGVPKYVFYCGQNKEFNNTSKTCEVVCKEAGRLPDSENCHNYYECTQNRVGSGFTASLNKCPTGTKFDSNNGMCVAGDCT